MGTISMPMQERTAPYPMLKSPPLAAPPPLSYAAGTNVRSYAPTSGLQPGGVYGYMQNTSGPAQAAWDPNDQQAYNAWIGASAGATGTPGGQALTRWNAEKAKRAGTAPSQTSSYESPARASAGMSTGAIPQMYGYGGQGGTGENWALGAPSGGAMPFGPGGGGYSGSTASPATLAGIYGAAISREDQLARGGAGLLQTVDQGYQGLAGATEARENKLTQFLQGLGDTQKTQLADERTQQQAASQQSAMSRGLGNTTVQDSLSRGINMDYSRALGELNTRLTREKMDYVTALSGDTLSARKSALENRRGSIGEWYGMSSAGAGTLKEFGKTLGAQQSAYYAAAPALQKAQLDAQTAMAKIGADERLGRISEQNRVALSTQQRQADMYGAKLGAQTAAAQQATSYQIALKQAGAQVAASPTGAAAANYARQYRW